MDTWDENLVIRLICWFYVKNCTFLHTTEQIFLVTGSLRRPLPLPIFPQSGRDRTASEFNIRAVSTAIIALKCTVVKLRAWDRQTDRHTERRIAVLLLIYLCPQPQVKHTLKSEMTTYVSVDAATVVAILFSWYSPGVTMCVSAGGVSQRTCELRTFANSASSVEHTGVFRRGVPPPKKNWRHLIRRLTGSWRIQFETCRPTQSFDDSFPCPEFVISLPNVFNQNDNA